MRSIRSTFAAATLAITASVAIPAGAAARPASFPLPAGFSAEALTAHNGALYVSSQTTGAVRRVDVRSGEQTVLVQGSPGLRANGLRFAGDHRLIVAGGTSGQIRVYDALTGTLLRAHETGTGGFVNGVAVLGATAYATDTLKHVVYAFPASGRGGVRTIAPGGDFTPAEFDLDGIVPAGRTLLTGQYGSGRLFALDPVSGAARTVDLGGALLPTNDGLALRGRLLVVAENRGKVQLVRLSADLRTGRVVKTIPKRRLRDPTDVALIGGRLYVLNSHTPTTPARTARQVDAILDLGPL